MNKNLITSALVEQGIFIDHQVDFTPLTGGVSSDIYLISDGRKKLVVKQARARLKVSDEWYADISRNETEQEFNLYVQKFRPEAVPRILYRDGRHGFFVMEFLDHSYKNWKDQLLSGLFDTDTVSKAAELMAALHRHSRHCEEAKKTFDTTANFRSLRIEPYLITTADRHPQLKKLFYEEAKRLEQCREALVHGDFSPKNIMTGAGRLVLLDHEAAWYGDPAFDLAFLLTHLYLKQLYHRRLSGGPAPAADGSEAEDYSGIFLKTYFEHAGEQWEQELECRAGRLQAMLMLARADGKSPAEYLDETGKNAIRRFAYKQLAEEKFNHGAMLARWKTELNQLPIENS